MTLGRINEALDVIAPVVSDQPNNSVAVNILRDLAERADEKQFERRPSLCTGGRDRPCER